MKKLSTAILLGLFASSPVLAHPGEAHPPAPKTDATMQTMDHSKMDMQGMDHSKMGNMQGMDMSKMDMKGPFAKSEMDMHMKMMSAKGTDAAETYNRKMIEHHRGALAMSQVALAQTRDPRTRATAQKIIAMQTKEIADLQDWLRSNNKRPQ